MQYNRKLVGRNPERGICPRHQDHMRYAKKNVYYRVPEPKWLQVYSVKYRSGTDTTWEAMLSKRPVGPARETWIWDRAC